MPRKAHSYTPLRNKARMNSSLRIFPSAPLPEESDTESAAEAIPPIPFETPSAQVDEELNDAVAEVVEDEEQDDEDNEDEEMSVHDLLEIRPAIDNPKLRCGINTRSPV